MNVLRGRLNTNGGLRFESRAFNTDVSAYPFQNPVAGDVVLGVRAEQVRLAHAESPDTPHQGTISVVEPLGPQKIIWFTVGEHTLSAIVDDQWEGLPNEPVFFGFDLPRASMFDAGSEVRL
jgi:multiple sugar transport system ATP-binding protein